MCYEEIRNRQVRTRKPTHCCWCAESIEKGDLAQYRVYNWEGVFNHDHMHPECYAAMEEVATEDLSGGWVLGEYSRGGTESHW